MTLSIPPHWTTILNEIKAAGFPEAVVAGGAMRDLYFGKPHKDLDIFIQTGPAPAGLASAINILKREFGSPTAVCTAPCVYMGWNPEVAGFVNFTIHGEDVQIVGINRDAFSMAAILRRIDFGICQIGWDGTNIEFTTAFFTDVANRTFTVNRQDNDNDLSRTYRRFERISARYPEHRIVVPAGQMTFEEWQRKEGSCLPFQFS